MAIKRAQRTVSKIKLAIQGPSGGGKTYSALSVAEALVELTAPDTEIGFIDTEKSAPNYSPPFQFDCEDDWGSVAHYSPKKLIEYLEAFKKPSPISGKPYGVVVVDSLTHFWDGPGGFCWQHGEIGKKQKAQGKNEDTWGNWKFIDPEYDNMWTYIRTYPIHLILCLRSEEKTERVNNKIVKQGLQAIFRKKWEYEVDAQFAVEDQGKVMVPLKHRMGTFLEDKVFEHPGRNVAEALVAWINDGAPGQDAPPPESKPSAAQQAAHAALAEEPIPAQAVSALIESLKNGIEAAKTTEELQAAAQRIAATKKTKELTDDDYKALSALFSAKNKALKAAEAAA